MKTGIYVIWNLIDGGWYIGSSINLTKRKWVHFSRLRNNKHSNKYLQFAFNKHKETNFKFYILEYCGVEDLLKQEQFWMDELKPEYNILKYAGHPTGFKHTEEFKTYIKNIHIGKKHTEETKKLIGAANKGNKRIDLSIRNKENNGGKHPKATKVIDIKTGVIYDCIKDAAYAINKPYSRIVQYLNGHRTNKTNLRKTTR